MRQSVAESNRKSLSAGSLSCVSGRHAVLHAQRREIQHDFSLSALEKKVAVKVRRIKSHKEKREKSAR